VVYNCGRGRFRNWVKDILKIFGYGTVYAGLAPMLWMEMIRLRTMQAQLENVAGLLLETLSRAA